MSAGGARDGGGRGGDAGEGPRASGSFARARARLCEVPASSRARARFRATPHVAAPAARARRPRGPAGRPRAEPTVRAHEGARRKWAADGRLAAAAAGRRSPADLAGALAPASRGEFPLAGTLTRRWMVSAGSPLQPGPPFWKVK